MKKGLFLLLLAPALYAEGPLYRMQDATINLEFQNVYQDLRSNRISSTTLPAGSTQYIQNTNTLQSGATAYPDYVSVGKLLNLNGVTGSSGTYPVSQGQNAAPIWQSRGLILQIVKSTQTSLTQQTSTSASYSSTTLTTNLTPVSSNSTILVFASESIGVSGTAGTQCTFRLRRDTTDIVTVSDQHGMINDSTTEADSTLSLIATDPSPGASLHNYMVRFARSGGGGTCIVNTTGATGNGGALLLIEVAN